MVSTAMLGYVKRAGETVRRWDTALNVPHDADDVRAASMIRSAMISAAAVASSREIGPFYPDDNSWSYNGIRGLTRERISEEVEIAEDNMAKAPEEWGIIARVSVGDVSFFVPIAIDLGESVATNIMARMIGHESVYVDVDAVARAFPVGDELTVQFIADNWGQLRDVARSGDLAMDVAMDFRRPVVWDLLRARLSELPPEPLHPFSAEEFYAHYARSARYDNSLMRSTRSMVSSVAKVKSEPLTPAWGEWFPAITDMLSMIGKAQPMDGISIILNFYVEEPLVDGTGWAPVGYHNTAVCYGLHPLTAINVLDLVREEPGYFFDMPETEHQRYVLAGVSAIHDSMLSSLRVSLTGRTDAYDVMVASEAAESEETATSESIDA